MTRICDCGHADDEHHEGRGLCQADVYRRELGRSFGCFCPQFDLDCDPNQQQKGI